MGIQSKVKVVLGDYNAGQKQPVVSLIIMNLLLLRGKILSLVLLVFI